MRKCLITQLHILEIVPSLLLQIIIIIYSHLLLILIIIIIPTNKIIILQQIFPLIIATTRVHIHLLISALSLQQQRNLPKFTRIILKLHKTALLIKPKRPIQHRRIFYIIKVYIRQKQSHSYILTIINLLLLNFLLQLLFPLPFLLYIMFTHLLNSLLQILAQ